MNTTQGNFKYLKYTPVILLSLSVLVPASAHYSGAIFSSSDGGLSLWRGGVLMIPMGLGLHYLLLPVGAIFLAGDRFGAAALCGVAASVTLAMWWVMGPNSMGLTIHLALLTATAIALIMLGVVMNFYKPEEKSEPKIFLND